MVKIIGAGLVTVDIVHLCDAAWRPLDIPPIYTSGGTVCNILSYLAKFGWDCTIIGGVGTDTLAQVIFEDLNSVQVKTDGLIPHPDILTRRIAQVIANGGERNNP